MSITLDDFDVDPQTKPVRGPIPIEGIASRTLRLPVTGLDGCDRHPRCQGVGEACSLIAIGCALRIDCLTAHPQRENWRPVPLPRPQVERFSKERGITSRIPSVAFPRSRISHPPSHRRSLRCRRGSAPPIHGCKQAALTRAEPVDIVRLVEILGERQVQLAQQMPKMIVAVD